MSRWEEGRAISEIGLNFHIFHLFKTYTFSAFFLQLYIFGCIVLFSSFILWQFFVYFLPTSSFEYLNVSVIDVDLIRAVVDFFYDGFRSKELLDRENPNGGEKNEEEEKIRNLSTYVISGLLDKQVLPSFDATSYAHKLRQQKKHKKHDTVRNEIFQDCASRAFCEVGSYFKELKGSALFFMSVSTPLLGPCLYCITCSRTLKCHDQ